MIDIFGRIAYNTNEIEIRYQLRIEKNFDMDRIEVIRMGVADITVLLLVGAATAGVVVYLRKQKKAGKSCCSGCSGCLSSCRVKTEAQSKEEMRCQ